MKEHAQHINRTSEKSDGRSSQEGKRVWQILYNIYPENGEGSLYLLFHFFPSI